jgi:hypothetical protein
MAFELLASEDEAQDVCGNVLTQGNERLEIGDRERGGYVKSYGYSWSRQVTLVS